MGGGSGVVPGRVLDLGCVCERGNAPSRRGRRVVAGFSDSVSSPRVGWRFLQSGAGSPAGRGRYFGIVRCTNGDREVEGGGDSAGLLGGGEFAATPRNSLPK